MLNLASQTGQVLAQMLTFRFSLGLTRRISNAMITAMAVPVKNSCLIQWAVSGTPLSASHWAMKRILPAKNTPAIRDIKISFLLVRLTTRSFQKDINLRLKG